MKSNTKKRLIAFMLCMVLVLSSATSAFADEPQKRDRKKHLYTSRNISTSRICKERSSMDNSDN